MAQPANVVAGTTSEGAALASVLSVGLGSGSLCDSETSGEGLVWPLFAWSALALSATEVAVTTDVGTGLASVRLITVGSGKHCDGGTTNDGAAQTSVRSVGVGSASQNDVGHDS